MLQGLLGRSKSKTGCTQFIFFIIFENGPKIVVTIVGPQIGSKTTNKDIFKFIFYIIFKYLLTRKFKQWQQNWLTIGLEPLILAWYLWNLLRVRPKFIQKFEKSLSKSDLIQCTLSSERLVHKFKFGLRQPWESWNHKWTHKILTIHSGQHEKSLEESSAITSGSTYNRYNEVLHSIALFFKLVGENTWCYSMKVLIITTNI